GAERRELIRLTAIWSSLVCVVGDTSRAIASEDWGRPTASSPAPSASASGGSSERMVSIRSRKLLFFLLKPLLPSCELDYLCCQVSIRRRGVRSRSVLGDRHTCK